MKLLVLDTCKGSNTADLFIFEAGKTDFEKMSLGYVPEIHYDAVNQQLVIVESEISKDKSELTRHWLKCFSTDNFELTLQVSIPQRPMYSGYPGRSNHVKSSLKGNYIYFLETDIHPEIIDLYRLLVHRYNLEKDEIESSSIIIDSCMIDFDQCGENEDELCFHLSCEFPSVLAFCKFDSNELNLVKMEDLPSRTHGSKETCGSWVSKDKKTIYCVNGEGSIFKINSDSKVSEKMTQLDLPQESSIPLQQIYGNNSSLLVGVSKNIGERGLSLASQIWKISAENGELLNKIELPFPIMNFVTTPDEQHIFGVSPYHKAFCLIEAKTGTILGMRDNIGNSPAEVLVIP